MRLDQYLHKLYPETSRSLLQRLIKNGSAKVNGIVQKKNGLVLKDSDKVSFDYETPQQGSVPDIDIEVLYEDKDCVVINKPLGLLTHSKGVFNPEATVATWLAKQKSFKFPESDGNARAGIVHRLDRATSGVMICAKNPVALRHLQKQFQDRKAKKTYIARIEGTIKPEAAVIDLPIDRNPKQPQKFRVGQNGKSAITNYKTLNVLELSGKQESLLELAPLTGRTHQLRVHLNYMKHPIIGDLFYDGKKSNRLYLHAHKLEITLPNKEREVFEAPVPKEFFSV